MSCTLDLFSIKSQERAKKKEEINEPELDENLHMQTENNNRMVCMWEEVLVAAGERASKRLLLKTF